MTKLKKKWRRTSKMSLKATDSAMQRNLKKECLREMKLKKLAKKKRRTLSSHLNQEWLMVKQSLQSRAALMQLLHQVLSPWLSPSITLGGTLIQLGEFTIPNLCKFWPQLLMTARLSCGISRTSKKIMRPPTASWSNTWHSEDIPDPWCQLLALSKFPTQKLKDFCSLLALKV